MINGMLLFLRIKFTHFFICNISLHLRSIFDVDLAIDEKKVGFLVSLLDKTPKLFTAFHELELYK